MMKFNILYGLITLCSLSSVRSDAATCCNTPTVWTYHNRDSRSVSLECKLEKSSAWSGKPLAISLPKLEAGKSHKHTWNSDWYADGMGMIPGQWVCKDVDNPKVAPLAFSTDWGENITVSWGGGKSTVARAGAR